MMTLREKITELLAMPVDIVDAEAESFIERAADWPVSTEVPLSQLAFVLVALCSIKDPHVRRATLTDGLEPRSYLGG